MATESDHAPRVTQVLVAEDDAIIAFDIVKSLLAAGADVVGPAICVERAIELAEAETVDCAILDIRFGDGLIFPAALVLRQKGARIIFCTAYSDLESLRRDWPESYIVAKPVMPKLLLEAVAACCPQLTIPREG